MGTLDATTTTGGIFVVQPTNAPTVSATSQGYTDPAAKTGSDISVTATAGDLTVGKVSALGTVTLTTGGRLSAPSGLSVSVAATTLGLTAANGIGTSDAVVVTSVNTLTAAGGSGGGIFVSK